MNKIAKNSSEAWDMQEKYDDEPHGWIQWKGTDVCMDVYCKCGFHGHVDEEFLYYVECPNCNAIYKVNGHVEFIELKDRPDYCVHLIHSS